MHGYIRVLAEFTVLACSSRSYLLAGQGDVHVDAGLYQGHEPQVVDAVVRKHLFWLRVDEQARSERDDQVAVRDDAVKERVGGCGLSIGVRVERVAGELGEPCDVVGGDPSRAGHDRLAESQLVQRLPEGVWAFGVTR